MIIYHITRQADWEQAQAAGQYRVDSLEQEGFIHASSRDQVAETARRYYAGQAGLVLLSIEVEKVKPEVRFDPVMRNGVEMKFPHIYGPLNVDAVVKVQPFDPDSNADLNLP